MQSLHTHLLHTHPLLRVIKELSKVVSGSVKNDNFFESLTSAFVHSSLYNVDVCFGFDAASQATKAKYARPTSFPPSPGSQPQFHPPGTNPAPGYGAPPFTGYGTQQPTGGAGTAYRPTSPLGQGPYGASGDYGPRPPPGYGQPSVGGHGAAASYGPAPTYGNPYSSYGTKNSTTAGAQ